MRKPWYVLFMMLVIGFTHAEEQNNEENGHAADEQENEGIGHG